MHKWLRIRNVFFNVSNIDYIEKTCLGENDGYPKGQWCIKVMSRGESFMFLYKNEESLDVELSDWIKFFSHP